MGGGQDPGRVWPGKKLPGRMGTQKRLARSLVVDKVNGMPDTGDATIAG